MPVRTLLFLFLSCLTFLVTKSCSIDMYRQQIEALSVGITLLVVWFRTEKTKFYSSSVYFVIDLIGIC